MPIACSIYLRRGCGRADGYGASGRAAAAHADISRSARAARVLHSGARNRALPPHAAHAGRTRRTHRPAEAAPSRLRARDDRRSSGVRHRCRRRRGGTRGLGKRGLVASRGARPRIEAQRAALVRHRDPALMGTPSSRPRLLDCSAEGVGSVLMIVALGWGWSERSCHAVCSKLSATFFSDPAGRTSHDFRSTSQIDRGPAAAAGAAAEACTLNCSKCARRGGAAVSPNEAPRLRHDPATVLRSSHAGYAGSRVQDPRHAARRGVIFVWAAARRQAHSAAVPLQPQIGRGSAHRVRRRAMRSRVDRWLRDIRTHEVGSRKGAEARVIRGLREAAGRPMAPRPLRESPRAIIAED